MIENDIPRWQGGTMLLVHSFFDYKICSQNCLNVKKTCLIWGSDTLSVLNAHLGAHTIIHGAPKVQRFLQSGLAVIHKLRFQDKVGSWTKNVQFLSMLIL